MISRTVKQAYFALGSVAMRANHAWYKRFRAPRSGTVRVHLGPGQRNYLQGWINLDANVVTSRPDVWVDLTHGLPFPDSTVSAVYSHHVIEHFPDSHLPTHCQELYRCLKPGGVVRIGCPSGDGAIAKFLEGDLEWFGDWPDKRASVGGRFANFLLCRGEHLTILTFSYLEELLANAGFVSIRQTTPRETQYPDLIDEALLKTEEGADHRLPRTLVVEAIKAV